MKTSQSVFDSTLMVLLVTSYFASIENCFRIIIKEIDPSYKGTKFYKICEKILECLDLKNYQDKFDFYRFLRNTLHNNGIVTDKHAHPIKYDGRWYNFEYGKHIQVNWRVLCLITSELGDCINKIFYHESLSRIAYIEDPSFFETPKFS